MMLLVIVGIGLVVYILFLYPALLASGVFRSARPLAKDIGFQPTVTVIIAVRNGEQFLRQKLESILDLDYPRELVDVLVVSDGSTDGTDSIAVSFQSQGVRLLRQEWAGKATAINTALEQARGDVLFFTDVRQPLNRPALRSLVANLADPTVGAVSGELRLLKPGQGEQADLDLYWRYEVWVRRQHARIGSIFGATGCIYAIRRELVSPLAPGTLSDDVMLPVRAFLQGFRVVFEPEAQAFDAPAVSGSEFRRKWRTLAGLLQVFVWEPRLFTWSGRMTIHFLSHKFGRLVLPWALLLILGAGAALPPGWFRTSLWIAEAILFGLAALDLLIPRGTSVKRLTSPARTFLAMNAASLAAISVFFVAPQTLWKPTQVDKGT